MTWQPVVYALAGIGVFSVVLMLLFVALLVDCARDPEYRP